jgi:hypothetical protein
MLWGREGVFDFDVSRAASIEVKPPVLRVAQLIGNGSRVWLNRRKLNWRVVAHIAYCRELNEAEQENIARAGLGAQPPS